MQRRESIKDTELRIVSIEGRKLVVFDPDTERFELYVANNHYAGHVLVVDGIGYEFCRSGFTAFNL